MARQNSSVWLLLLGIAISASIFQTTAGYNTGDGPNVCGTFMGMTQCCTGWTKSIDGLCTLAICKGNCGERGKCIAPNQCRCGDGTVRQDCMEPDDYGFLADEPVRCPSNCNNQGSCVDGKCICEFGFAGGACEEEELGPCFLQMERGVCQNKVVTSRNDTVKMTRNGCCGSVGVAWGDKCQTCASRRSYCGKGYTLLDHKCVDVNECEIPNVCSGGICRNTEGFYECECAYGYVFDKNTLRCRPIQNGCQKNPNACKPGGRCIPLYGASYICQCDPGYVAMDSNTRCEREQGTLNYCEIFEGKLCKNGECHPTDTSYECTCNPGYVQSRYKKQCIKEFNACNLYGSTVCSNGQCVPAGRFFRCICNPGYLLSSDGTACLDKCQQLGSNVCQNGFCVPRPYGEYECRCHYGYKPSADRKSCLMQLNPFQTSKRDSWYSNGNGFRYSYQADLPQEIKVPSSASKPLLLQSLQNVLPAPYYPNPCEDAAIKRRCTGGFCLNVGRGQYECKCFRGYRAVNGNRHCIRDFRNLYSQYNWPMRGQNRLY